jgi:hypothetical protein
MTLTSTVTRITRVISIPQYVNSLLGKDGQLLACFQNLTATHRVTCIWKAPVYFLEKRLDDVSMHHLNVGTECESNKVHSSMLREFDWELLCSNE